MNRPQNDKKEEIIKEDTKKDKKAEDDLFAAFSQPQNKPKEETKKEKQEDDLFAAFSQPQSKPKEETKKEINDELTEIAKKYGDERKTTIDMTAIDYIEDESLIPEQDVIITITNKNYIKRMTTDTYKTQHRGGVGIKGMTTNEEDFVEQIIKSVVLYGKYTFGHLISPLC